MQVFERYLVTLGIVTVMSLNRTPTKSGLDPRLAIARPHDKFSLLRMGLQKSCCKNQRLHFLFSCRKVSTCQQPPTSFSEPK